MVKSIEITHYISLCCSILHITKAKSPSMFWLKKITPISSLFTEVDETSARRGSHASAIMSTVIDDTLVPSAPEADTEPEPEDHEVPKDSTLTEISDGPPRYRALFPPGYVPVLTDEGLPPPPSYEESQRVSTETL